VVARFPANKLELTRAGRTKPWEGAMNDLKQLFSEVLWDESGQDLIEYALVAALIALGATAAMRTLATTIGSAFASVGARLTGAI
jgi:pilus assembly protein Flp/PilA